MSEAKKIKSVRNEYADNGGPYAVVTLGISINGNDYILGSFYNGPNSPPGYFEEMESVENDIDEIIESFNY